MALGGPGDRGPGHVRLGSAVAWCVKNTFPLDSRAANQLTDLISFDEPRLDSMLIRRLYPPGELLCFLVSVRRDHDALFLETDIFADLSLQLPPDTQAFDDHRHLARVAKLLPHPTPIAPGLLAGNQSFFTQHHVDALLREKPGRGDANNATTDDDDVGRYRYRLGFRHRFLPGLRDKIGW
jgi:hypothetical protein